VPDLAEFHFGHGGDAAVGEEGGLLVGEFQAFRAQPIQWNGMAHTIFHLQNDLPVAHFHEGGADGFLLVAGPWEQFGLLADGRWQLAKECEQKQEWKARRHGGREIRALGR
jgi:hypothetical protein